MLVYKFGGASVANADRIIAVSKIIAETSGPLIVVVSAIGKTTNALETVVKSYVDSDGKAHDHLTAVKRDHFSLVKELLGDAAKATLHDINDHFAEIEWILEDSVHDSYDYLYDQIVSIGEMVSSTILQAALTMNAVDSCLLDARSVILTNEDYRTATVDLPKTADRISKAVQSKHARHRVIVTQGFVGGTSDNNTTTLGREGSDYTAGIFAFCLGAESLHIWKDVPGILTADPQLFENTIKIDRLSYQEAIEMAYYGAKVIHPKTIKPLQNKGISLYVRPFASPDNDGTVINAEGSASYPPMIVVEADQTMLYIKTRDFSFVGEFELQEIFRLMAKHNVKVNMMRNTAISFTVSTNAPSSAVDELVTDLRKTFEVDVDRDLELVTIRHYDQDTIERLSVGRVVLYEESLRSSYQMVTKDIPMLMRK